MREFSNALGYITIYASAAIAILYALGFFKFKKVYKIFTIYLLAIAAVQLTAHFIGRGGARQHNLHISHYYYVAQFVLLTWFYAVLLRKKWPYYVMIPVLLLIVYQFIDYPGLYYEYNPIGMALTHIILVIFAIVYLYQSISNRGSFVLTTGALLVYLLVSALIFASGNLLLSLDITNEVKATLNDLNRILYFVFQVVVIVEWFVNYNAINRRLHSAN